MIFIDSDNALGAPSGDIDDAFAIAAMLRSREPVIALASIFGNTSEAWAAKCNEELARVCGYTGPLLRGADQPQADDSAAARFLVATSQRFRVLALGPLTNLALALRRDPQLPERVTEVIAVVGNLDCRLPAWRIFDFNQWNDPDATRVVFDSQLRLTIIPCSVARGLRARHSDLRAIAGPLGEHLRRHSRRWYRRALLLKAVRSIPIWDLVAAQYALESSSCRYRDTTGFIDERGRFRFGAGTRPVRVVEGFEASRLWASFLEQVS